MTDKLDRRFFLTAASAMGIAACSRATGKEEETPPTTKESASVTEQAPSSIPDYDKWQLSDAEWKKRLSPEAYAVLRKEGTERPWTSPLNDEKRAGVYSCAGCGYDLFTSETKYDSGTGWPSFWQSLPDAVGTKPDRKLLRVRTEVH
ncbi:MAG: peptide-methionine (R)-S-oxide reductase, partial [Pseudomonadota bacterium]